MKIEDIEIPRYTPEVVDYYKSDGTYLGEIRNEYEFNKLRIELVKNDLTQDCYFMWKDKKITLSKDGDMSSFPIGLYDIVQRDLAELIRVRKNKF